MSSKPNYFVCTLGEAALPFFRRPFEDINNLLEVQSTHNPRLPAIGFYHVNADEASAEFETKVLTFQEVQHGIQATASLLLEQLDDHHVETIGLLSSSSPEFLFTWLALVRLGHPVLLIAPQCSPSSIAKLCKSCNVSLLLVDEKSKDLGSRAAEHSTNSVSWKLVCQRTPLASFSEVTQYVTDVQLSSIPEVRIKAEDVAYLHHTSGTSSGTPKPIPQTHKGVVGVVPALDGGTAATFSTTPLYHGAPADIFRAWNSNAMIWLFPGKDMPITATNVIKCLRGSRRAAEQGLAPYVKYFTSVPYILQLMAADGEGLRWLTGIDLVGVGGASLATEVGDRLVRNGVNLVSRYGSAECGFLLASHRDYANDKLWQYLRHTPGNSCLKFEARDDGLYELVVGPEWPHISKRNREDGSFATSDLFSPHPTVPDAWKYHSRADSQLTLTTGKKFDPAPIENEIEAASPMLSNVLVFGNDRPYPGALLFRSKKADGATDETLLQHIGPIVEALNAIGQSHTQIPLNMLVPMPFATEPLEKSSKGTIIRNKAEELYATNIAAAYGKGIQGLSCNIADNKIEHTLLEHVKSLVGTQEDEKANIGPQSDLFAHGIDSVVCVQIRNAVQQLLQKGVCQPSLTIVEDSRTIAKLTEEVLRLRHGGQISSRTDQRNQIPDLVDKYSGPIVSKHDGSPKTDTQSTSEMPTTAVSPQNWSILLTGATGSLGSHVLSILLALPPAQVEHIYILTRGATPQASRERVLKALTTRQLQIPPDLDQRLTILPYNLSSPTLGLSPTTYAHISANIATILHLAWNVNFLLTLQSFEPHLSGLRNLIDLALSPTLQNHPPMNLVFCSSIASVSNYLSTLSSNTATLQIPEHIVTNPQASGPTGYAASKHTAELLLQRLAKIHPTLTKHKSITIIRVGQVSGSTATGVWSRSEAYPLILASGKVTGGLLPDLGEEEILSWLPVDIAGKAFVEAALETSANLVNDDIEQHGDGVRVLHLLNPETKHTFTDFLVRLQSILHGNVEGTGAVTGASSKIQDFKIVSAQTWLQRLESTRDEDGIPADDAAFFKLVPFWAALYAMRQPQLAVLKGIGCCTGSDGNKSEESGDFDKAVASSEITGRGGARDVNGSLASGLPSRWEMKQSLNAMPCLREWLMRVNMRETSSLLQDDYIRKVWHWVYANLP